MPSKIRHTFDVCVAVEMAPAAIRLVSDIDPVIEPNGRSFLPLGEMRASTVVEDTVSDADAVRKVIKTACYWYKQQNPDWADSRLVGLSPELVKRGLVR